MALIVKHNKVATAADDPAAEVNKAEWNDAHAVTGTLDAASVAGLAAVATTGAYGDLSGRPTLGTAAAAATADFDAAGSAAAVSSSLATHEADRANPHAVTAAQVGSYATAQADALLAAKAPLDSPALSGTPTAPTATAGTSTTQLATTAFVAAAVAGLGTGSGTVTSVGLSVPAGLAVAGSPVTSSGTLAISTTLSGVLKGTGSGFAAAVAGTDYVSPAGSYADPAWIAALAGSKVVGDIAGNAASITGSVAESQVTGLVADLAARAPLDSPALSGTPTAPTPAAADASAALATTAFVKGQGYLTSAPAYDLLAALSAPEVAVAGAATLSFGRMHACGGSADYAVTLPTPTGNAGKLIGVRVSPSATALVTISPSASETIDGATSRILWAGESAVLLCDGTNWYKVAGKTVPMAAVMHLGSNQAIDSVTMTKINLGVVDADRGGLTDPTNKQVIVRRPGFYDISGQFWVNNIAAVIGLIDLYRNGVQLYETYGNSPGTSYSLVPKGEVLASLSAGDTIDLRGYHNASGSYSIVGDPSTLYTFLTIAEIPSW